MPANKKFDKQLRFFSTKVKRRPLQQALQKPSSAAITAVKEGLMQNPIDNASATGIVFDIPDYVDTEEVDTS